MDSPRPGKKNTSPARESKNHGESFQSLSRSIWEMVAGAPRAVPDPPPPAVPSVVVVQDGWTPRTAQRTSQ